MVSASKNLLSIINFRQTQDWSIKHFFSTTPIISDFKLKPIGKSIHRVKDTMNVLSDNLYKRITIKINNGGVSIRDIESGANIKTKNQYYVRAGQLIVSKIDARNGAFGIVPIEAEQAIITGNFWTFDVDKKYANIQYLVLVFSSSFFVQSWQDCSNGSGNRLYLQESKFLDCKIPFPDLYEQTLLVKKYEDTIAEAEYCEKEVERLDASIEEYLFDVLGIDTNKKIADTNKLFKNYYLSQISRWDAWTQNNEFCSRKYKYISLEHFIVGSPLYGANEKAKKEISDTRYIRITDINEDGSLNDEFVSAVKVENKYLLEDNDFLIARSGNTVGKTFLYNSRFGRCIFAGYLIKYMLETDKIIPEYLLYYTKSSLFKSWIKSNQRIFGQPNINGQEYLKAQIIVPEIKEQEQIVSHISEIKHQIKALRQKAEGLRNLAKKEFEEAVFSEA